MTMLTYSIQDEAIIVKLARAEEVPFILACFYREPTAESARAVTHTPRLDTPGACFTIHSGQINVPDLLRFLLRRATAISR